MTLQPLSSTKVRWAQLAASLLVLQTTIATTAISAVVFTQRVSAQSVSPMASSAPSFKIQPPETQQPKTQHLSLTAKDLVPPQAVACWKNAVSQACSFTIHTAQHLSLELPKPDQSNIAAIVLPPQAKTCWARAGSQDCSYTISVSPSDRLKPYPLQLLSELPFDAPVNRFILVRIPF